MNVWKTEVLALSMAVLVACGGCQLSDPEAGLQLSRMIPKPELGSAVPPQHEPDPDSLYEPETAKTEAVGENP